MGVMKRLYEEEVDSLEPDPPGWDDPKNYNRSKKMALGKSKKSSKTSSKGKSSSKKSKKDNSSKRYVASIWSNEGDNGDYLSMSVDNLDPDSEYNKGSLIWYDKETEKYYKVKSMSVYGADKGPKNLTNKLVLDLENEYHVEEMEA
jgi:hypothetical protein